ncbi:MAG: GldG family protein [Myxococcota bacterium]|nr:GldG family protein [Myxococcota bacterium]
METNQRESRGSSVGRFTGAIGAVFLVSLPLTWLLTDELGLIFWTKLGLGVAGVLLYLVTERSFWSRQIGGRSTSLYLMSLLSALFVIGAVAALNVYMAQRPVEWDLTKDKIYTLSDQTQKVMQGLRQPVKVYGFLRNTEPYYAAIKETFERYQALSEEFSYQMVDPIIDAQLAQKFGIQAEGARVVIESGERSVQVKEVSEETLTNAVVEVTNRVAKKIHYLIGHGELNIDNATEALGAKAFRDAVSAEGHELVPLNLSQIESVETRKKVDLTAPNATTFRFPSDVKVLVIAGAQRPLLAPELQAVEDFLDRGGRLLALLDPMVNIGLDSIFLSWGIIVDDTVIVDTNPMGQMMGLGAVTPLIVPVPETQHPITEGLGLTVFHTTRTVRVNEDAPRGLEVVALLRGGESAWGEAKIEDDTAEQTDDDIYETTVAVLSEKPQKNPSLELISDATRLLVLGDSDVATNQHLTIQSNTDFLMNGLNFLLEDEALLTIRPKNRQSGLLTLTQKDFGRIQFFSLDVLPVLLIALGLGIVTLRRQR